MIPPKRKPAVRRRIRMAQAPKENEKQRLDPLMRALKALHSANLPDSMTPEELERQRKGQELLGKLTANMSGMRWEEFDLSGMRCGWMRVDHPHPQHYAILYCHGGGYTSGNLGYSRVLASKLTGSTGFDTLSFEYRLAPEHPYPAAAEDASRAWDYLMHLGYGARDIIVAGDSAGGNLALVLCQRLKAEKRMLPGALLLMSPWTDMTMSGPSYAERAEIDPMLSVGYIESVRQAYAGATPYAVPELSPLFADLTGYPPALIQVGTHEILYSDAEQLAGRLTAAGCTCVFQAYEDMWHVFQMFPTKKAAAAIRMIPSFLLENWKR